MAGCMESLEMFLFGVAMCMAKNQGLSSCGGDMLGYKCQPLGHGHGPFLLFCPFKGKTWFRSLLYPKGPAQDK